jgi:hypothetical protein
LRHTLKPGSVPYRVLFILKFGAASTLFLHLKLKDGFNEHVFSPEGF